MKKLVNGEEIDLSPEEINEVEAERAAMAALPNPFTPTPVPAVTAMAELKIVGEDIEGVATSCNVAAAVMLDVGLFWIFFNRPEPDAEYLAFVQSPGYTVDVMHREPDYFEVAVTNRSTNEPATPERFSISVQRVS